MNELVHILFNNRILYKIQQDSENVKTNTKTEAERVVGNSLNIAAKVYFFVEASKSELPEKSVYAKMLNDLADGLRLRENEFQIQEIVSVNDLESALENLQNKKLIFFGEFTDLGIGGLHQLVSWRGYESIRSFSVNELMDKRENKLQLWNELKTWFKL